MVAKNLGRMCFSFVLVAFTACAANPPKPAVSSLAKTVGAGFAIEGGKEIKYGMTYELREQAEAVNLIKIEFENPQDITAPIMLEKSIGDVSQNLVIESSALPCIVNHHYY